MAAGCPAVGGTGARPRRFLGVNWVEQAPRCRPTGGRQLDDHNAPSRRPCAGDEAPRFEGRHHAGRRGAVMPTAAAKSRASIAPTPQTTDHEGVQLRRSGGQHLRFHASGIAVELRNRFGSRHIARKSSGQMADSSTILRSAGRRAVSVDAVRIAQCRAPGASQAFAELTRDVEQGQHVVLRGAEVDEARPQHTWPSIKADDS